MKKVTIGIVAHVDAGKTTITEQLLYKAGELRQIGSVDKGTAHTDFLEIERQRGISVKSASVTLTVGNTQINIIDTPGHVDFVAEVERSLSILDCAILVISAVEGIQAQTEILYEALKQTNTNIIFFINKIDRVGSDTSKVISQIKEKFTEHIILFTKTCYEGEKNCEVSIHSLEQESFREEVIEALADQDEQLLEDYLAQKEMTVQRLEEAMQEQVQQAKLLPILCGSGMMGVGIDSLLSFIVTYMKPSKENKTDSLSGVVYRVTHDAQVGRIAHVRMFGGSIKNRDTVQFANSELVEKITQIRKYTGNRFVDVGQATSGDVVALLGLQNANIFDIIGESYDRAGFQLAVPLLKVRVLPAKAEDLYALFQAFGELCAEDPQLDMEYFEEEKEINISITGKIQLEILGAIIKQRFMLDVAFSPPTVIYQETPSESGNGFEAYTMPKPCWAVISLDIKPMPRKTGLVYQSLVSNDKIFQRYQNHIKTALPRALKQGLYNWQVTDLSVTLTDGHHHTMHTHPMDFFLATPLALMDGLRNTGTTLLEPMQLIRITAQEEWIGKVIGDIIAMRGEFDSPVITKGMFTLEAKVPIATSLDYATQLASMTGGRGMMSARFAEYQPCAIELGAVAKRRGVNPLDRDRWILNQRNALK